MHKLIVHLYALIVAISLVSCAPQPIAPGHVGLLHPGGTWDGIAYAVRGGIGTEVWNHGNIWMFVWPSNGRAAFAGVDVKSCCTADIIRILTPKANLVNFDTWAQEMRPWLNNNGWYKMPLSTIPAGLIKVFGGTTFTFIIVPEGLILPNYGGELIQE